MSRLEELFKKSGTVHFNPVGPRIYEQKSLVFHSLYTRVNILVHTKRWEGVEVVFVGADYLKCKGAL